MKHEIYQLNLLYFVIWPNKHQILDWPLKKVKISPIIGYMGPKSSILVEVSLAPLYSKLGRQSPPDFLVTGIPNSTHEQPHSKIKSKESHIGFECLMLKKLFNVAYNSHFKVWRSSGFDRVMTIWFNIRPVILAASSGLHMRIKR